MIRHMFLGSLPDFVFEKTQELTKELDEFRTRLYENNEIDFCMPFYDLEYRENFERELQEWFDDDYRSDGAFANFSEAEKKFLLDVYDAFNFKDFLNFNTLKEDEKTKEKALMHIEYPPNSFYEGLYKYNKALFEKELFSHNDIDLIIEAKFHTLHKKLFVSFEDKIKELEKTLPLFKIQNEKELDFILTKYPLSAISFEYLPHLKNEVKEPNLFSDEELKPSKQNIEIKSYDEIMEAKLRKRGIFK